MNVKTIKLLIGFFLGVICLIALLISLSFFDSKPPVTGFSATATAQRILAEAAANANTREKAPPSYRTGLSTENITSQGAIMLEKSGEFGGVAEDEQQGALDVLTEMSGSNKKKIAPIRLTEQDLDKKVVISRTNEPEPPLHSAVPGVNDSTSTPRTEVKTMITAPVDYQLFTNRESWLAFASSHKGRFPEADFSKERMLILVSVSDLPSGIFKITGLKKNPRETVVLYRVDPMAMSAESEAREQNYYSAVSVPKRGDVKLEQVP